jgi:hypothetical protein
VLSGSEVVQQTLSVTNGTWQGVAPISFGYQWKRDGVNIAGATSNTYTLVAADYGAVISCDIPANNSLGTTTAQSNETGAIAGLAPTNDTAPSIAGNDSLGDTLTRTAGSWSGVPTPSVSGQWRRNGVAIPSETGATYTIVAADSGASIDYIETATNAEGSATQDSNDITVQTFAAPTIGAGLSIAGTEEVGSTLTATAASVTGNPTPTRTWQWQRSADGSTGWADIAGATNSTYLLDAADEGKFVRAKQIETNALGSDEAVSAASGEIQPSSAAGLLDPDYKGSAFAMSPDTLLYGSYSATDDISGSVTNGDPGQFSVAILRDSDNAVRSFTPAEVADGTANTWVQAGVGGAANGFVRRGYDQSVTALNVSNLNHGDQTTTANMPKLFDSSTGLILENGKAAMDYSAGSFLDFIQPVSGSTSHSFIFVAKTNDAATAPTLGNTVLDINSSTGGSGELMRNCLESKYAVRVSGVTQASYTLNLQSLFFQEFSGVRVDDIRVWQNDTELTMSSNATSFDIAENGTARIGQASESSAVLDAVLQLLVFWTPSQVSNRSDIQSIINTEYNNIY